MLLFLCIGCKRKYQVNILCNNIDLIKNGDHVQHLGIKIGEVSDFEIIHNKAMIRLAILKKYAIPAGSFFYIKNKDLFGNKFIDVIYSNDTSSINNNDTLNMSIDTTSKKVNLIDSATHRNIDTLIKLVTKGIEKISKPK